MNTTQLKHLLIDLKYDDPKFFKELIGDILTENLSIESKAKESWHAPKYTYALSFDHTEFSRAY